MTTMNLITDLDEVFGFEKKQSSPMVFVDDPVALACCAWRHREYMDLANARPTDEDRALAVKVRRHFVEKLTLERLKNERVSEFRQKLGAFLVGNHQLLENEIGLLYRLPYFYFEDQFQQELIDKVAQVPVVQPATQRVQLTPLSSTVIKRRSGDVQQYWWIDSEYRPYCLSIRTSADNQNLYQSIWQFHSISVEAHMFVRPFPGTERYFYKLVGTKLLGVTTHND